MSAAASIVGENERNRIIGPNGGVIKMTVILKAPLAVNPGNLGITITSPANLGSVTIQRGHKPVTGLSNNGVGIGRYYMLIPSITPASMLLSGMVI
jgi:hypothetical protein